jgi:hypothetical protein
MKNITVIAIEDAITIGDEADGHIPLIELNLAAMDVMNSPILTVSDAIGAIPPNNNSISPT